MSEHIPEATKMVCPHCQAGVLIMDNGKQCRAASGAWVTFSCLTSIHQGHDPRMSQSRKCEEAERNRLIMEVAALRTANKALVERVKRLEESGDKLSAAFEKEWLADGDIEAIQDDWNQAKEEKP